MLRLTEVGRWGNQGRENQEWPPDWGFVHGVSSDASDRNEEDCGKRAGF